MILAEDDRFLKLLGKPERVIGALSDTHAGSEKSAAGEKEFRLTGEAQVYHPAMRNEGQIELWERWQETIRDFDRYHVDTVFCLGDICEGTAPWDGGQSTMLNSIEVQFEMAVDQWKPIVKDRKLFTVSASLAHESVDTRLHRRFAQRLEPHTYESRYCGVVKQLKIPECNDVTFNIAHKATNAMIYTSTIEDRESLFAQAAEARDKLPRIHIFLRGHLHIYNMIDNGYHHFIQVPCYKSWFPYKGATRLYGKVQPDIGYVMIFCYESGEVLIKRKLWTAPLIANSTIIA